jgi:hypothetical protein
MIVSFICWEKVFNESSSDELKEYWMLINLVFHS